MQAPSPSLALRVWRITGRPRSAASVQLRLQRALLLLVLHALPVIVQPDLADCHDLAVPSQIAQLDSAFGAVVRAVVRVNAKRRVNVRMAVGKRQDPAAGIQVDCRVNDPGYPGLQPPVR